VGGRGEDKTYVKWEKRKVMGFEVSQAMPACPLGRLEIR
jgi:hypothetical protein